MMGSHFEMIGGDKIQNEQTRMDGNSPYGCAKFAAHNYIRVLRESKDAYVCSGILYNHGSPLRGEDFFERKVTKYVGSLINFAYRTIARPEDVQFFDEHIEYNGQSFPKLRLGDLSTYRDMGHSKDYVKAMWAMLQQDTPEDFIICTGETFQMKDIVREAFQCVGLDWEKYVVIDPKFFRPREVEYLRGDCSKAKQKLGWFPEYDLKAMIKEMVDQDIIWASEGKNYG
jgi:GDPmannose 4,6-dehydratase